MRELNVILDEALAKRDENAEKLDKHVENIIEAALKEFQKPYVTMVLIRYSNENYREKVIIGPKGENVQEFTIGEASLAAYKQIKEILSSDDAKMRKIKDKLSIKILDDFTTIILELK